MSEKINFEEFKKKVLEKMEEYEPHKTKKELEEALNDEEYLDILEDGYNDRFGVEYGIKYAAHNITMCI